MVKGFIGVGILALPSGFAMSGWLGGIVFFTLCSVMMYYLSQKIVEIANLRRSKARSVTEFWVECMGEEYAQIANVFLFAIQLGICVAYIIFFVTYFNESLCYFVNHDHSSFFCSSRIPAFVVSIGLCAPAIFIREMAKLKSWSIIANSLIFFSLLVIVISCLGEIGGEKSSSSSSMPVAIDALRLSEIGQAIGIFIFTFEGTTLYFEVRNSMRNPEEFSEVLRYSIGGSVAVYASVGLAGYLAFGRSVHDIILFNFSMDKPLFVFIQISYCVAILLSYPLQMFPLVNILEIHLMKRIKKQSGYAIFSDVEKVPVIAEQKQTKEPVPLKAEGDGNPPELLSPVVVMQMEETRQLQSMIEEEVIMKEFLFQSNILRIVSLLGVALLATLFTSISSFLNLIGSVSGCFFCFVLPVLTYQRSMPNAEKKVLRLHWGILSFGVIFSVYGTYSSLSKMLS